MLDMYDYLKDEYAGIPFCITEYTENKVVELLKKILTESSLEERLKLAVDLALEDLEPDIRLKVSDYCSSKAYSCIYNLMN